MLMLNTQKAFCMTHQCDLNTLYVNVEPSAVAEFNSNDKFKYIIC